MQDLERHFGLEGFSGYLPLFPLPEVVLFPCTLLPLHVFEPRYQKMVRDAAASEGFIGMVKLQPGWELAYPANPPIHGIACLGKMIEKVELSDGRFNIVLCGVKRVQVEAVVQDAPYRTAWVTLLDDQTVDGREGEADHLKERLLHLADQLPPALLKHRRLATALRKLDAPLGCLADLMSDSLRLPAALKQQVLEDLDVIHRAKRLLRAIEERVGMLPAVPLRRFPPEPSVN